MIDGPGHFDRPPRDPLKEDTTMLKTISAALLAVSVLAVPALAATSGKTTQAPVVKAEQVKQAKPNVLNANARMGRHHVRHASHHRFHKHYGALKTHKFSKVSSKHVPAATKRG
jgi:anti-sigma-K factor RskA